MSSDNSTAMANLGAYVGVYLVSTTLYISRRNKEPIVSRGFWTPFLQTTIAALHMISLMLMAPPSQMLCGFLYWETQLFIPLWAFPYMLRGFHLYTQYTWNAHIDFAVDDSNSLHSTGSGVTASGFTKSFFIRRFPWLCRYWPKFAIYCVAVAVCLIISIIVAVKYPDGEANGSCRLTESTLIPLLFEAALGIVVLIWVVYLLAPVRDSYKIKAELIVMVVAAVPCLIIWTVIRLMDKGSYLQQETPLIFMLYCTVIATLLMPAMATYMYSRWYNYEPVNVKESVLLDFLAPSPHHEPDIEEGMEDETLPAKTLAVKNPTSRNMTSRSRSTTFGTRTKTLKESINMPILFRMVLSHHILAKSFEQFTVISFCAESLAFYKRVNVFGASKNEGESLLKEAKLIQQIFLLDSSPQQINIDDVVAKHVNQQIASGKVTTDLFVEAQDDVFSQLLKGVFPIWINDHCKKTLAEHDMKSLRDLYDEFVAADSVDTLPVGNFWTVHNYKTKKRLSNSQKEAVAERTSSQDERVPPPSSLRPESAEVAPPAGLVSQRQQQRRKPKKKNQKTQFADEVGNNADKIPLEDLQDPEKRAMATDTETGSTSPTSPMSPMSPTSAAFDPDETIETPKLDATPEAEEEEER